jgi:hypothetical protein
MLVPIKCVANRNIESPVYNIRVCKKNFAKIHVEIIPCILEIPNACHQNTRIRVTRMQNASNQEYQNIDSVVSITNII